MIHRVSSRDAARLLAGLRAAYVTADDMGLIRPMVSGWRSRGQEVPGADRAGTSPNAERPGGKFADQDFGRVFESVWDGFVGTDRHPDAQTTAPHNIIVSDDTVVIEVAVAGYKAEDVSVTAIDPTDSKAGAIVVEGKPRKDDRKFVKREVAEHNLHCVFDLPRGYKVATADCKDGLLSVTCEKIAEKPAGRKIDIGGGK